MFGVSLKILLLKFGPKASQVRSFSDDLVNVTEIQRH
jgi:hypothetical protein